MANVDEYFKYFSMKHVIVCCSKQLICKKLKSLKFGYLFFYNNFTEKISYKESVPHKVTFLDLMKLFKILLDDKLPLKIQFFFCSTNAHLNKNYS